MKTGEATGGWQLVTRRRNPQPPQVATYKPYSASYADAVRRDSPPSPQKAAPHPPPRQTSSKPPTTYYISHHSSAQLRFPPSPRYVEWRGRCFRCCRMGHSAAKCKNPKKCGRCWRDGHIGALCKQKGLNTEAQPFSPASATLTKTRGEPGFQELLHGTTVNSALPENRPQKVICFVARDEEYFEERAKIDKAVVMHNPNLEIDLTMEEVADYAATSGVVKASEVQVGVMPRSRYIIMLPDNIDPATFIKSIPLSVWNKGFSFSLWSPLMDATRAMPHFKVVIDLIGLPLDIYREKEVICAVSSFGTYLGSIEQSKEGDVAFWTVVVATTDLELIPHQIGFRVGELERVVDVFPKNWIHCDVYRPADFVQPQEQFFPPSQPPSPIETTSNEEEDDHFIGSRKVLEELCHSIDFEDSSRDSLLPAGIQAVLKGARSMTDRPEQFLDRKQQGVALQHSIKAAIENPITPICQHPVIDGAGIENDSISLIEECLRDQGDTDRVESSEVGGGQIVSHFPSHLDNDTPNTTQEGLQNNLKVALQEDHDPRSVVEMSEEERCITGQETDGARGVAGQPKSTRCNATKFAAQNLHHLTPINTTNKEVIVQIQSAPITASSGANSLFLETNVPKILQRGKDKATDYFQGDSSCNPCSHSPLDAQQQNKPGHGPWRLRETTRLKRKIREEAQQKQKKMDPKRMSRNKKKAQFINENGMVEVQVAFKHCSAIAQATGLEVSQVLCALEEENAQRQPPNPEDHVHGYDPEEGDFVFDPDSDAESGSDLD